ncbi:MAG: FecR domain-containing protein [Candidatus Omnitrophica bacterium]|nr:FecR domain-containing protein [Candidatus Omnitrophota bacterium]
MKNLIAIIMMICLVCFAQTSVENQIILVKKKGAVFIWDVAERKWVDIPVNASIRPGSFIKVEKESEAIIAFGNVSEKKSSAVITLSENTVIQLVFSLFEKNQLKEAKINAAYGKIWSVIEKVPDQQTKFEIETPNAIAGARGTVFMVAYDKQDNSSRVSVIQGEVGVSSKFATGLVILRENMSTVVVANKPPIPPQLLEEKEKLEWEQWKQNIPFSQIGAIGGIAEMNAMQIQEASRIVRELGIAKKGSQKVQKDFNDIESAILLYYADTKNVPGKLNDLMVNPGVPGWKGPYLGAGTNFMDPYGRRYFYRIKETPTGRKYIELYCAGLIGAAGDTYGEERRHIYIDKLDAELQKRVEQMGK